MASKKANDAVYILGLAVEYGREIIPRVDRSVVVKGPAVWSLAMVIKEETERTPRGADAARQAVLYPRKEEPTAPACRHLEKIGAANAARCSSAIIRSAFIGTVSVFLDEQLEEGPLTWTLARRCRGRVPTGNGDGNGADGDRDGGRARGLRL